MKHAASPVIALLLSLAIPHTAAAQSSPNDEALPLPRPVQAVFDAFDKPLHPIIGGPMGNHLEAYSTLGFIAAQTERVRLLAMATAASYRPAGLLGKATVEKV